MPEFVDLRVHDLVALDEIELYAEVLGAVAASDGPLSREELDEVLGVRPTPSVLGRIAYEHLPEPARRLAWRWLRHQADSPLSRWFAERTGGEKGRIRKIMAVALARKLLVMLWRYAETGVIPDGVRLAAA